MKNTLYMHMGWSKTGTTTIQHFLYKNHDLLLEKDYCYPIGHVIDESVFNYKYENHIFAAQCFHGNWNKFQKLHDWTWYRDHILNEMRDANCSNNILSAELFNFEHSDNIEFWKKDYSVKGIYYFRNFFDWLVSQQKEYIKYFLPPSVFVFDRERNYAIMGCLRHHLRVLGRDNCIFIDFDKVKKRKNGLLESFLDAVDVGAHALSGFSVVPDENTTPNDAHLMFFYQCSFAPFGRREFSSLFKEVREMDLHQFKDFHSNTLPPNIYTLDEYAEYGLKYQGVLLNDPDWYDKNVARAQELAKIPYQDLPPEIQYHILENLSDASRELIYSWLPGAKQATPNQPYLPSMKNFYDFRDTILPIYKRYSDLMRQE
ncbi:MAG: hypothetical protein HDQ90_00200 [Desulfovibrio sp.]|nr:hypothetical protein [Desulfovibrio sp.]